MANATRTEIFDVDINKIYNIMIDYKKYPEFVTGISEIEVIEQTETSAKVKYTVNLIKKVSYVLNLKQIAPTEVSWSLDSGDMFKVNNGKWTFKELGENKTEATFSSEVAFKVFAPKMIVNKLVGSSLPAMMKEYHQRAKSL